MVQVGNGDGSFTFSGTFTPGTYAGIPGCISSSIALQKTGAGVFTFAGNGTSAGTEVAQGTMLVNGVLNGSGVLVDAGATLGGNGAMSDSVAVNGILQPGPGPSVSVGTLTTGPETWDGGASYNVGISNAALAGGVDLLSISGSLDILSSSGSPFTINLDTLTSSNTPGSMADFDPAESYSWKIATASGGIQNFNTNEFVLNTSGFANAYTGVFSLGVTNHSLVINYTGPGPLTPPTLTGYGLSGGLFHLTFTGPSNQTYTVLSSTNLALPLPDWTVVGTGVFNGSPASYTNSTPTLPAQFYQIKSP